jgi:hypothetical protein
MTITEWFFLGVMVALTPSMIALAFMLWNAPAEEDLEMMDKQTLRAVVERATRELMDKGLLIEAGFTAFRIMKLEGASPAQVNDMRVAFFAGAQHLFGSLNSGLEKDAEPTDADLRRMENIFNELQMFGAELEALFDERQRQ